MNHKTSVVLAVVTAAACAGCGPIDKGGEPFDLSESGSIDEAQPTSREEGTDGASNGGDASPTSGSSTLDPPTGGGASGPANEPQPSPQGGAGAGGSYSIVTFAYLEGDADDPFCCNDVDADGFIDNELGMVWAATGLIDDTNQSTNDALFDGEYALFLEEHSDGATWYRGTGVHEGASVEFAAASLRSTAPGSYQGALLLPMQVAIATLWLQVSVDELYIGEFVGWGDEWEGLLGGSVDVDQFFDAVNDAARLSCDCLGSNAMVLDEYGTCVDADVTACEAQGATGCVGLVDECPAISLISAFADVDRDGDGLNEAVSVGYVLGFRRDPTLTALP